MQRHSDMRYYKKTVCRFEVIFKVRSVRIDQIICASIYIKKKCFIQVF